MGTVLTVILYAILMILVFGVLIFIHEFGHFFTARRCGVAIKEFAVGMGPTLISWRSKKYDTRYALRAFPIG
jgi:regulator of sigma E protease